MPDTPLCQSPSIIGKLVGLRSARFWGMWIASEHP